MISIMDKLGNARRWAARMAANLAHTTMVEDVLVDLVRAVEVLAMEREDKPASATGGHDAFPTAQEILDAWATVPGITVQERGTIALDVARAHVMPELSARDKRIAELEKELAVTNDVYTDEREERGMYQARVEELEQAWDMLKKSLDESDLQRNEALAKVAQLEKLIRSQSPADEGDGSRVNRRQGLSGRNSKRPSPPTGKPRGK